LEITLGAYMEIAWYSPIGELMCIMLTLHLITLLPYFKEKRNYIRAVKKLNSLKNIAKGTRRR